LLGVLKERLVNQFSDIINAGDGGLFAGLLINSSYLMEHSAGGLLCGAACTASRAGQMIF